MPNNPQTIGNHFGYLCPQCGTGDALRVAATVWVALLPDGTENCSGDTEWEDDANALCDCGWAGQVKEFKQAENFEEE